MDRPCDMALEYLTSTAARRSADARDLIPEAAGYSKRNPSANAIGIVGQGETEEAALEDAKMALESTPEAGDGEAANGAEDLGGTPHPFDARFNLEALASEQGVEPAHDFDAL
jgi:hypothetical protein